MQYPISVNFESTPIKFCNNDEDFVAVVSIVIKANPLKIDDFCAQMVDFHRPGHIWYTYIYKHIVVHDRQWHSKISAN